MQMQMLSYVRFGTTFGLMIMRGRTAVMQVARLGEIDVPSWESWSAS